MAMAIISAMTALMAFINFFKLTTGKTCKF